MAQFSIDDLKDASETQFNGENSVSFFTLKSGEEAIVRIMIDSYDDFQLCTVHNINLNGKIRRISCLRDNPSDAISKCPLCESGLQLDKKLYVPMLQYFTNENGNIDVKPVIWTERSMAMAKKLRSYLENYGPLSQILCKIIRKGSGLETEWDILPNPNPMIYKPEMFPLKPELFNGYKALGTIVLDKNYDEIKTFIATGTFPEVKHENSVNKTVDQHAASQTVAGFTPVETDEVAFTDETEKEFQVRPEELPWAKTNTEAQPQTQVTRPVRTF